MNEFNIILTSIFCICFYVEVSPVYRDHALRPAQSQLWLAFKSGSLPTLALTSLPAPTADCVNLRAFMHRCFVEVARQTNLSPRSLDRYFVSSVCDRICLTIGNRDYFCPNVVKSQTGDQGCDDVRLVYLM